MLKKLLVPLDGSAFSEQALPVAVALARQSGAGLVLVRVIEVIAPNEHEPGVVSYLDEHRITEADNYIYRMANSTGIVDVTADAYLAADVTAGIIASAVDAGVDTIVMTTHGRSWPGAAPFGSVAAQLVAESPVPVLLVGPRATPTTIPLQSSSASRVG